MSANQTHIVENKKTFISYKNLIPKIKITEVRQIHIIAFWVTLVFFILFILTILNDITK